MGVWLPLALASLYQAITALVQNHAKANFKGVKPMSLPKKSELLASWMLPAMAEAMGVEEKSAKAKEEFDAVVRFARKYGNVKNEKPR